MLTEASASRPSLPLGPIVPSSPPPQAASASANASADIRGQLPAPAFKTCALKFCKFIEFPALDSWCALYRCDPRRWRSITDWVCRREVNKVTEAPDSRTGRSCRAPAA
jgi:hypothetical protein